MNKEHLGILKYPEKGITDSFKVSLKFWMLMNQKVSEQMYNRGLPQAISAKMTTKAYDLFNGKPPLPIRAFLAIASEMARPEDSY